jgi:hypothetical protein
MRRRKELTGLAGNEGTAVGGALGSFVVGGREQRRRPHGLGAEKMKNVEGRRKETIRLRWRRLGENLASSQHVRAINTSANVRPRFLGLGSTRPAVIVLFHATPYKFRGGDALVSRAPAHADCCR